MDRPRHAFIRRIEQQLNARPQGPAIQSGETCISYRQLWDEVARLQSLLSSFKVQRLALALANCPAWIALDLAAAMEGIVLVPVPHFFSEAQIQHLLLDSGIDCLLSDGQYAAGLDTGFEAVYDESFTCLGSGLQLRILRTLDKGEPTLSGAAESCDSGCLKISYTSGTTGEPKGVLISGAQVSRTVDALIDVLDTSTAQRHLSVLPFSLLLENIVGIYAVLASGGCCCVADFESLGMRGSSSIDWRKFSTTIERVQPTSMITVPAMLQGLIYCVSALSLDPRSLAFIAVGGAPISSTLLEQANQIGLPVFQGYGLTECGSVISLNTPSSNRVGSVGQPLPHVELRISEQGEIMVSGINFRGYAHHPARESEHEWATGDLGYLDNQGFLYVTARKSTAYSTAYGRNIAPEWVESELDSEMAISQSAVFGEGRQGNISLLVPATRDIDDTRLAACVAATNRRLPDYARIAAWLRADTGFDVANGQRSAAGALRREKIYTDYRPLIEQLFIEIAA